MAFTQGCHNLQIIIQKLVIPPIHIDPSSLMAVVCPVYLTKKLSAPRIAWNFVVLNASYIPILALSQIYWLISTWQTHRDMEQLGFYIMVFAVFCIIKEGYRTCQFHTQEICDLITERYRIVKFIPHGMRH